MHLTWLCLDEGVSGSKPAASALPIRSAAQTLRRGNSSPNQTRSSSPKENRVRCYHDLCPMGRVTRRAFLSAAAPALAAQRPSRKGSKIPSEKVETVDPLTGRPLFRLTNPEILHHLPHYHHHFVARNNSFLLLASERSGTRQIYRLNLPDGDMLQLTQGPGVHSYSAAMDARRRNVFYLQQDSLKQAAPRGGREKTLYRSPTGWRPTGHLSVSDDGKFAALVEIRPGQQTDGFEETVPPPAALPYTSGGYREEGNVDGHRGKPLAGPSAVPPPVAGSALRSRGPLGAG